jgi:hypothetical protein
VIPQEHWHEPPARLQVSLSVVVAPDAPELATTPLVPDVPAPLVPELPELPELPEVPELPDEEPESVLLLHAPAKAMAEAAAKVKAQSRTCFIKTSGAAS